jgi:hypothetical protein
MASVFEQIVKAIHDELDDTNLAYSSFRLSQQEHTGLRRVVWIPTSFRTTPVRQTKALRGEDGEIREAMYEEEWDVECHITGATFEDAESVRERLIYAARETLGTDCRPSGGTWVTQAMNEAEAMLGTVQKVVQRFTWTVNVLKPLANAIMVETIETAAMDGDDDTNSFELTDTDPPELTDPQQPA